MPPMASAFSRSRTSLLVTSFAAPSLTCGSSLATFLRGRGWGSPPACAPLTSALFQRPRLHHPSSWPGCTLPYVLVLGPVVVCTGGLGGGVLRASALPVACKSFAFKLRNFSSTSKRSWPMLMSPISAWSRINSGTSSRSAPSWLTLSSPPPFCTMPSAAAAGSGFDCLSSQSL